MVLPESVDLPVHTEVLGVHLPAIEEVHQRVPRVALRVQVRLGRPPYNLRKLMRQTRSKEV